MNKDLKDFEEKDLFQYVKENLIDDLTPTEEFSFDDATSKRYGMHIEFKCRKKHYDTLLIEKHKYYTLISHPKCRYINSTPLGIFSFDLHTIDEPVWQLMNLPKTTEFGCRTMIEKLVGMISIDKAKKIV